MNYFLKEIQNVFPKSANKVLKRASIETQKKNAQPKKQKLSNKNRKFGEKLKYACRTLSRSPNN